MEGLINSGTEFARMAVASLGSAEFTLFDIGCSGGIDPAWRCFAEKLVAFGFDANCDECLRLSGIEPNPRVEYIAGFVGLPPGHQFLRRRGRRASWTGNPWNRLSAQRSIEIRQSRAPNMSAEQLRDMNLWSQTNLADPDSPVVLRELAVARGIADVDFVKIDVDGEDFAILNSIADELAAWNVLGVGLEVNFFGSANETDHTFHNMDRFMRCNGFDLFNLTVRRYSHRALPSKYTWHNPSQTITGRPLQGDAIYLRDVCAESGAPFAERLDTAKLLKLAAIASLAETPDTAGEILLRFRDRLELAIDVARALDLLAGQAQSRLGLAPPMRYQEYIDAFEADAPFFYTPSPT
jgi:methyltransferase FkbM-like protein